MNTNVELYTLYSGDGETIADLIPYMLESFLEGDRNFAKTFKEHESKGEVHSNQPTCAALLSAVDRGIKRADCYMIPI